MSRIITIAGQKGGAGKSVTAVNLATSFSLFEKKTLLIDYDPQGCSTRWIGVNELGNSVTITSVLTAKVRFKEALLKTEFNYLDVIPSDFNLFQAALKLSRKKENEKILKLLLKEVKDEYEYIIIDTPSSYEFLFISAVTAADYLLMCATPTQNSAFDFEYLLKTLKYIKLVRNTHINIAGVLFNRCDNNEQIDQFIKTQEINDFKSMVLNTYIPEDEIIEKSIRQNVPAVLEDIKSSAVQSYLNAAKEIHDILTKGV